MEKTVLTVVLLLTLFQPKDKLLFLLVYASVQLRGYQSNFQN